MGASPTWRQKRTEDFRPPRHPGLSIGIQPHVKECRQHLPSAASSRPGMDEPNPPLPGPRNLPRASHACQRCRAKKARCDQRQPCANCIKHLEECTYGLRRRNNRSRHSRVPSLDRRGAESPQRRLPTLPSARDGRDEPPRGSQNLEHSQESDRVGEFTPLPSHKAT